MVSGILFILSTIDFALAAPVLVQEKCQACVDVLRMGYRRQRSDIGDRRNWFDDMCNRTGMARAGNYRWDKFLSRSRMAGCVLSSVHALSLEGRKVSTSHGVLIPLAAGLETFHRPG